MTQQTFDIRGLSAGDYNSKDTDFGPGEVWDQLFVSPLDDPTLTQQLGGTPLAIVTRSSTRGARVVRESALAPRRTPFEVGRFLVENLIDLGHQVRVYDPNSIRGGFRQAISVPTVTQADTVQWDHNLFAPERPAEIQGGDNMTLNLALFYRRGVIHLKAGWFRIFCSNQLVDDRLNLVPSMKHLGSVDDDQVATWLRSAIATASMSGQIDRGLPQKPIGWLAEQFFAEIPDSRVSDIKTRIVEAVGSTGASVLSHQIQALALAKKVGPVDVINAVTNLTRPRWTWQGGDAVSLGGNQDLPIVSPSTVYRHQENVVDALLQGFFIGVLETGSLSHPIIENSPYQLA
jgi:hypothetical protein